MQTEIKVQVENIKCGGCEKSIVRGLQSIEGVTEVQVDRQQQTVSAFGDALLRLPVVEKLRSMGYPEKGSVSGLEAGFVGAKSFVSCAIGRMA